MKDLDPCAPADKPITRRMVTKRGLVAIRYRTHDEVRHGWIVSIEAKETRIQLLGDARVCRVKGDERRYIQALP